MWQTFLHVSFLLVEIKAWFHLFRWLVTGLNGDLRCYHCAQVQHRLMMRNVKWYALESTFFVSEERHHQPWERLTFIWQEDKSIFRVALWKSARPIPRVLLFPLSSCRNLSCGGPTLMSLSFFVLAKRGGKTPVRSASKCFFPQKLPPICSRNTICFPFNTVFLSQDVINEKKERKRYERKLQLPCSFCRDELWRFPRLESLISQDINLSVFNISFWETTAAKQVMQAICKVILRFPTAN